MKNIKFVDIESGEESVAIVRPEGKNIGLCLSIEKGADVKVYMSESTALELSLALKEAAEKMD